MKMKATLFLATPDELAAVQRARLNQADKTKHTRDHNGFRKLLVVLTKAGKISALHTGDGHVVWSLLVPSLRASYGNPRFSPLKIFQWQVPHQHALDENPVVLILAQAGNFDSFRFLVISASISSFTCILVFIFIFIFSIDACSLVIRFFILVSGLESSPSKFA